MPHPLHRRLLAEDLTRRRRADEQRRWAASQRRGRIDPNPHQLDAVAFALRRLPEGGCILADEVGLGKTIEAGLVIAQLLAEGARRVLLIVPKPLLGQWQAELQTLFGLAAQEGAADPDAFAGDGVFLAGRELAGGEKGASVLRAVDPFDLVVIDEAHEVFSGLWRRYDKHGDYDPESAEARMAGRVRALLGATPVLLLTATPIQNSLAELWGLVQFVEPTGTLLGKLPTFRRLFCDGDDRRLAPGQAHELRRRLGSVLQRTLRRQAQEFLDVPFVERRTRLVEFAMSPDERRLYDDVTRWLLEPDLVAFRGASRRLLLIGFHRRMASSLAALAESLRRVAERLRRALGGDDTAAAEQDELAALTRDLEVEQDELAPEPDEGAPEAELVVEKTAPGRAPGKQRIQAELARVEEFARRAAALPADGKVAALVEVVRRARERGRAGEGSGKVVVFTESITTQEELARRLVEAGVVTQDEVTLFRGQNDGPRARAALARWETDVGDKLPPGSRPTPAVATRLALVDEFRRRSAVLVATEAGAKGLNLQFCETVVNHDLPWNPQRIEQRIGRCHRYGQTRGVTVVSFLARDNEAQRLTFDILAQKLDLFGKVLDASDAVLHSPATDAPEPLAGLGAGVEARLARIWERARSLEEVTAQLKALRESIGAERQAFDEAQARAAALIETRLDEAVRSVFRRYRQELPAGLQELDRDVERLVTGFLEAVGAAFDRRDEGGRVRLELRPCPRLPDGWRDGGVVVIGHARDLGDADPLHLGHPLVKAAVEEARAALPGGRARVRLRPRGAWPAALDALRGRRGRLVVTRVEHRGFEPFDHLLATALVEGRPGPLDAATTQALLALEAEEAPDLAPPAVDPAALEDAVDAARDEDQARTTAGDQERFERALLQVERYVDDQALVLRRERAEVEERTAKAAKRREGSVGPDARARVDAELARLESRRDDLDARLARLDAREDPDYEAWRRRAHERRYARPVAVRVLDVEWVLA